MQKSIRLFLSFFTLTLLVGALTFKDHSFKLVSEIEVSSITESKVDCLFPLKVIPVVPIFKDNQIEFKFSSLKREVIGFYHVDLFSWSDIPPPEFV
jgi:hypothetical protein